MTFVPWHRLSGREHRFITLVLHPQLHPWGPGGGPYTPEWLFLEGCRHDPVTDEIIVPGGSRYRVRDL